MITARTRSKWKPCPDCGVRSSRVHSNTSAGLVTRRLMARASSSVSRCSASDASTRAAQGAQSPRTCRTCFGPTPAEPSGCMAPKRLWS